MKLNDYLKALTDHDGSDLYLLSDAVPSMKINGRIKALQKNVMTADKIKAMALDIMDQKQREDFLSGQEVDLSFMLPDVGRFRMNIYNQRNEAAIVARNIKTQIPSFDQLGMPPIFADLAVEKRGLVLFVGATGSGKSTSMASMVDYRNSTAPGHIITIEDPVEFLHPHKLCLVSQREIGVDSASFHSALRNTLRQAPDVILIGEIRDRETMEHALAFAETGHLIISSLHSNNSYQALDRIINFFPQDRRNQILNDLSANLKGIISQRLVPTPTGKPLAAVEGLLGTPRVKELILRGQFREIREAMEKSETLGMKTFDSALFDLYKANKITFEQALRNADSANNLRLRIKLSKMDHNKPGKKMQAENSVITN